MRLINVRTLELQEFFGAKIPVYAILSHTWNDGEATYQHWQDLRVASQQAGFYKIRSACRKAQSYNIDWLWVDTNCIDKTSSAELTEAINSMFKWYAKAEICFAYLSDVATAEVSTEEVLSQFRSSRWFTRGWTLQELLAPQNMTFYAADWTKIGSKDRSLADLINEITGIDQAFLTEQKSIASASIAKKMSWLAQRETTREEDIAYCMLGLFDVNMPLLYGEGMKAFTRLQEEIIKVSNDHTIFCWSWISSVPQDWVSLLAPSPDTFRDAGHFIRPDTYLRPNQISVYTMTNAGLSIRLPVLYTFGHYLLVLEAISNHTGTINTEERHAIPVAGPRLKNLHVVRAPFPKHPVLFDVQLAGHIHAETLTVLARLDTLLASCVNSWKNFKNPENSYGLQLAFNSLNLRERLCPEEIETVVGDFDVLTSITKFPIHRVRSLSRFTEVGGCLLDMGTPKTELSSKQESNPTEDIRLHAYLFLAVKVTSMRGYSEKQWFCQTFLTNFQRGSWEYRDTITTKLITQVIESDNEQRAHYCPELDVSLVIGSRVDPTRTQVRLLHISSGRRNWVASNSAPELNYSDRPGSDNSDGDWTDADSNVAAFRDNPTLSALKRGQFVLADFR